MGQFQNLSQVSRLDKSSFPNPDYVFLFYFIFLPNQIISTELSQHNNVEKWKFQHVCVQQMYTANIYYGWLLSCFDMFEIVWTVSRGDNLTVLHLNDYKSLVVVHLTRTNQTCTFFRGDYFFGDMTTFEISPNLSRWFWCYSFFVANNISVSHLCDLNNNSFSCDIRPFAWLVRWDFGVIYSCVHIPHLIIFRAALLSPPGWPPVVRCWLRWHRSPRGRSHPQRGRCPISLPSGRARCHGSWRL